MSDTISRQAAIEALWSLDVELRPSAIDAILNMLNGLPSAQPETKPIGYQECANAMLKMWINNVVTDGEYSRIMDKLNSYWIKTDG